MKFYLFILSLLLFSFNLSHTQTFIGTGGPLKDDNTLADFTIDVQGLVPAIMNEDHGLTRVCINLTHTWVSDLDIRLLTPDGTNIMLTAVKGDDLDNYENTCFDMQAPEHIVTAIAPFTGDFRPFTPLGNANNGSSGNGVWTLRIFDQFPYADSGEMLDWSLTFGENASAPFEFGSSTLPIVVLNTDNITVPNEPKIPGTIKVIDNGGYPNHLNDPAVFESNIAIEVRGASSQGFPKKSFGFETQDEFGLDLQTSLLGLPEEEDWILYAPYTDKSFIRDALTYKIGMDLGQYASRTVYVELFLNKDYHGIYCLAEKIKRDKQRVNIEKLEETDVTGDALTGGYIIKVDRDDGPETYFVSQFDGTDTASEIRVVYVEPEGPAMHPLQRAYIQNFYNGFETALYGDDFKDPELGYRKYIDVPSLVDYFIVNELGHNADAYRLSTYLYKDRDSKDPLMHLGPLWDFNLAYGNVNYCDCQNTQGWAYINPSYCGNTPVWWARFIEDPYFVEAVKCRYASLREDVLSTERIMEYIDSMALLFADVESRNYERWPILGIWIWPNHFIGQTYEEEIDYMKNWITDRLAWMDDNLPGECLVATDNPISYEMSISPSPANDEIRIHLNDSEIMSGEIRITSMTGVDVFAKKISFGEGINISHLPMGSYIVSVSSGEKVFQGRLLIMN